MRPWTVIFLAASIWLSGCGGGEEQPTKAAENAGEGGTAADASRAPSRKALARSPHQVIGSSEHSLPPEPLGESWRHVEIKATAAGGKDVYVDDLNITRFSRPHHIYAAQVAPDDRHLLVWHMDYSPRKLSIYDLKKAGKFITIEPGVGGHIRWADHNLIYHHFRFGTNTSFWSIYSVDGKTVWSGGASGGGLDDSGRYIIVLPSIAITNEHIAIADVRDGRVYARCRPYQFAYSVTYTWIDGRTLRVWYRTLDDLTKSVDLKLDLKNPEPWEVIGTPDEL